MNIVAEYIWLDGGRPTQQLRSKTKVMRRDESSSEWDASSVCLADFPIWTFDGSSTDQATGDKSDCILRPVCFVPDLIRSDSFTKTSYLVMCEVFNANGTPHITNTRAELRSIVEKTFNHEPLFGIEQEYTLFMNNRPLGWQIGDTPPVQGQFYCGVGINNICGRELVESHLDVCIESGLTICGINAEVMPGQWEFQIGTADPLTVSDHLWLARWILHRLGERYGISVSLEAKPVKELNGAGAHTNFSTKEMRSEGGLDIIKSACEKLHSRHQQHIENYGDGIEQRLTGHHETCSYKEFRWGVSDRGASIRIPLQVEQSGRGYLEDRRPCASVDPYTATRLILETILIK